MAVAMERAECPGVALDRAFRLAYYIHKDKQTALQIAASAMTRLETTTAAQDKRLYYTPKGRPLSDSLKSNGFRNKVTLNNLDLLQLLVFIESEPYEKQRESGNNCREISEDDMVVHFIKHLVTMTMKRNSFYVVLGVCRLLYNYSTSETMDIYTVLLQDPDRTKDDHYYRSRKGRLMREIKARFGGLISPCRGPHGEERFCSLEHPDRYVGLVRESLNLFSPWRAFCPVPAGFNPTRDLLACLSSQGRVLDDYHRAEANRIHAILHPDCFGRLTQALAFGHPESRLSLPHFFLSRGNNGGNGNGGGRSDRGRPPELDEKDRAGITQCLEDQAARRRAVNGRMFRVRIDGEECAAIDLGKSNSVRIEVDPAATMIEVIARDACGEVLMATHLLNLEQPEAHVYVIRLEGGQEISFEFQPRSESERGQISLAIKYDATSRSGRTAWLQHLKRRLRRSQESSRHKEPRSVRALLALSTALVVTGAVLLYIQITRVSPGRIPVTISDNSPAAGQSHAPSGREAPGNSQPDIKTPSGPRPHSRDEARGRRKATNPRGTRHEDSKLIAGAARLGSPSLDDATREPDSNFTRASLLNVRLIYVECRGDERVATVLRDVLTSELQASGRFKVSDRDHADAALKVSATPLRQTAVREHNENRIARVREGVRVRAQLVNAAGEVVWQTVKTVAGDLNALPAREAAAGMLQNIERRIRELEKVRK